jgi:hypothetical protein
VDRCRAPADEINGSRLYSAIAGRRARRSINHCLRNRIRWGQPLCDGDRASPQAGWSDFITVGQVATRTFPCRDATSLAACSSGGVETYLYETN